jgi:hypothetical protein
VIDAKMDWQGDKALTFVKKLSWDGIRRAAHYFWERLQDALNVPNSGVRTKGRDGKQRTIYPSPSKPGEPPRVRTAFLRKNTIEEFDEKNMVARIGVTSNAKYGLWLELGTIRMKARPFLLATLNKFMSQIRTLASSGEA